LIEHNVITQTLGDGVVAEEGTLPTVTGNDISRNRGNGVSVDPAADYEPSSILLIGNRIVGNLLDGVLVGPKTVSEHIHGWAPPVVEANTVDRNGDDGINVKNWTATVTGNHAWWNGDLGIEAVPGVTGGGNWAKHNGSPAQCAPRSLCSASGKPKNH